MPDFNCLYLLENFYLYILEVKLIGPNEEAPALEKSSWLKIEKETGAITQLTFRSMDSSGEIEERYFEQGFLKFNATLGTFIEKYNSAQHPLERKSPENLPEQITALISEFLEQPETN